MNKWELYKEIKTFLYIYIYEFITLSRSLDIILFQ